MAQVTGQDGVRDAEIFWAPGWGAAFIVVFGTLTIRLCNHK